VVLAAVEAAVAVGGEAAAPHLLPLLASPEPEIVKAAARRLAGFGGAPVTAALLPLLGSPDWGVRAAAAEALGRRRAEEARGPLRARLALEDDEVAREAIRRALEALG
jgi:HEAT repeat protein